MTDLTDPMPFEGGALGTALHDRVRDERPDLDQLVRLSTRTGTTIRRRRRVGVVIGAAACLAAVAAGTVLLDGSGDPVGTQRGEPGFATDPPSSRSSEVDQGGRRLSREARAHARALQALQGAPVYVDSPDWRCDQPLDEKFICSQGGASVVVNWRPAAAWDDYQSSAKAGWETFVSDVHGDFFATVVPGQAATRAQVIEVGEALVWADSSAE